MSAFTSTSARQFARTKPQVHQEPGRRVAGDGEGWHGVGEFHCQDFEHGPHREGVLLDELPIDVLEVPLVHA